MHDSIGDVEQALPGEEEALDGYLKKTPGSDPYALLAGLPGRAVVTDDTSGSGSAARCRSLPGPVPARWSGTDAEATP